jgi:hypothetical protein
MQNTRAKVLLYAPARWGKTTLIRTCPKPLVLATEIGDTKGLQSLKDDDIPFIEIEDIDTLHAVVAELGRKSGKVEYAGETFETIVLDSLSATGELWLDEAKAIHGWDMVWDAGDGPKGVARKDPRQAYPYVAEKGRQTAKIIMGLDAHCLFLAREAVIEEGQGKEKIVFWAPELPGQKLPRELPGWPDATLRGVIQNGKRMICTTTIARTVAGFRVPLNFSVPTYIGTNMTEVFKLTMGDKSALQALVAQRKAEAPVPVRS